MEKLCFNPNWSYRELSMNLKTLRILYRQKLASFSYFQTKEMVQKLASFSYFQTKEMVAFKRQIKKTIYSYPFQEFLCNFAWEYLNLPEYTAENYNEPR